MKQELEIKGRVQLSREEVAEAAVAFVTSQDKLTKAIDAWLMSKHKLSSTRIRYAKEENGIQTAVVDIKTNLVDNTIAKFSDDPKETRKSQGGFQRPNLGIFKFIKETLAEAKKKSPEKGKKKEVSFDELYKDVKFNYPKMTEDRLALYLYDKRVLPDVTFNKQDKTIRV